MAENTNLKDYELALSAVRERTDFVPKVGIVLGSVFQAFSKSVYSLIISICRQLVVLIPAAWLLAQTGVLTNVWFSFLIAEGISMVLTVMFFRKIYNEIVKPMEGSIAGQVNS